MIFDDYNPIIFALSLVLGYVCWKRFTQITANKSLGKYMDKRLKEIHKNAKILE